MSDLTIKICSLYMKRSKTEPMIETDELLLKENFGIPGDYHGGSEKELSILPYETLEWMKDKENDEICLKKFKPNIVYKGSVKELEKNSIIIAESSEIKIMEDSKECHPNICKRYHNSEMCLLKRTARYGKVIKSGKILKNEIVKISKK